MSLCLRSVPLTACELREGSFRQEFHKHHGTSCRPYGSQRYRWCRFRSFRRAHLILWGSWRISSSRHLMQPGILSRRRWRSQSLHPVPSPVLRRVRAYDRSSEPVPDLPAQDLHGWCARCCGHGCSCRSSWMEDRCYVLRSTLILPHGTGYSRFSTERWSSYPGQGPWCQARNEPDRFLYR